MFKKAVLSLSLLVLSLPSSADPSSWFLGAEGKWQGTLYYLDYQSGQQFGIPMAQTVRTTPDGATLIRETTWTDPGNLVYAVSLNTIDEETGEFVESFYREGSAEHSRYKVTDSEFHSIESWRFTYEHIGEDDNREATIRHIIEREGDQIKSSKSVRFDGSEAFILRNRTELSLVN